MKSCLRLAAVLVFAAAGCGAPMPSNGDGATTNDGSSMGCGPAAYPASQPGACAKYDVVKDLAVRVQTGADGTPAMKKMSDYRADCPGKYKVLAIFAGAEWCIPCQMEQPELVRSWNKYKAANAPVAFVDFVAQDKDHRPSTDDVVKSWATVYGIPFDLASDPDKTLDCFFDPTRFPQTMVITLEDMAIFDFKTGRADADNWLEATVDAALQ